MTTANLVPLDDPDRSQGARGDEHHDDGDHREGDRWATKDGKLYRRKLVATLTLRGWTQRDIARELGVSKTTVTKDQAWNRERWRERAGEAFDAHVARALHILDRALAFDLSILEDPAKSDSMRMAARDGVFANHDRYARLMGLDKPMKIEATVTVDIEAERARGLRLVDAAREARERAAG